jgi:intracellular septation protein A
VIPGGDGQPASSGRTSPPPAPPPQSTQAQILALVLELAPLLVFWVVDWLAGLKPAIAFAVASILLDAGWRLWRRLPFTHLYLMTSGLVVLFGAIDLWSASPFMLKYEATLTNVATGAAFVVGARGRRPLLQEIAERQGDDFGDGPDIRRFFQLFTLFWAGYFFLKAAAYLAIGQMFPMERAMAIRSIGGGISLGVMVLVSTQAPRLFALCRHLGLLPADSRFPDLQS